MVDDRESQVVEMRSPDQVAAKQMALQKCIIHQRHEEQQRRKGASKERHKLGRMAQRGRRELLDVLLRCLMTGVQPTHIRGKCCSLSKRL